LNGKHRFYPLELVEIVHNKYSCANASLESGIKSPGLMIDDEEENQWQRKNFSQKW
jgi:hypothetical protein